MFRPGFLQKVSRTSVVEHYGIRTLLYGTLLPGPDIARKCAALMRSVRDAGFEMGIHTYDHVRWQDGVAGADAAWTRAEMNKAVEAFKSVFGASPLTHGAAGWQMNNAAYQHSQEGLEEISEAQLRRTFETNIYGYFFMAQAALPFLKPGSSIINCGSITGLEGSKHLLDYSATKGAIHAFTKSLAQNLVERGISVNCVAPGPIWTPLNVADKPAKKVARHGATTPMKRPGQPDEVAPAFVFFASNGDSSYISGEVLTVLGGDTTAG